MAGQSRGKGKALNTIAARSGRDPAAIVDSIQAAEKAQAKAAAAAAKKAAVKKSEEEAAAAAAAAKRKAEQEKETSSSSLTAIDNEVNNNITPAQIYSSLSPQEQYRYECFRRSGFASKPIEKFVANILVDEANKRFVSRRGIISGLGGRFNNHHNWKDNFYGGVGTISAATVTDSSDADNGHSKRKKKQSKKQMLREESKRRRIAMDHPPPYLLPDSNSGSSGSNCTQKAGSTTIPQLDQLVVPSSAPEIVAVISTLAKSYAQRLVSAARRVANAEHEQQKCLDESSTKEETASSSATATATATPILPHHLLEAHRYRSRVGLDPGFWMTERVDVDGSSRKATSSIHHASSSVGTSEAAALGIQDRTRSCFLAAIAAQDAYDKVTANTNDVEKNMSSDKHKEDENKMDVDKK